MVSGDGPLGRSQAGVVPTSGPSVWILDPLFPALVAALGAIDLAWLPPRAFLPAGAFLLCLAAFVVYRRRGPGVARATAPTRTLRTAAVALAWLLTIALLLAPLVARLHRSAAQRGRDQYAAAERKELQAVIEARKEQVVDRLLRAASEATRLPGVQDPEAPPSASLFDALEALRRRHSRDGTPPLAIGVYSAGLAPRAWAGRTSDLAPLWGRVPRGPDVLVLSGTVATTFVALAPIVDPAGRPAGVAAAEMPVRGIDAPHDAALLAEDALIGGLAGIGITYHDFRTPPPSPGDELLLRTPAGNVLASVHIQTTGVSQRQAALVRLDRLAGAGLLTVLFFIGVALRPTAARVVLGATLLRALLAVLETSSSTAIAVEDRIVGLWANPLALVMTTAWALLLAATILRAALRHATEAPGPWRAVLGDGAAVPVLAGMLLALRAIVHRWPLDVETVETVPATLDQLLLRLALLAVTAAGACLLVACLTQGGSARTRPRRLALRGTLWVGFALAWLQFQPDSRAELPLLPLLALVGVSVATATTLPLWRDRLRDASPYSRALVLLVALGALAAITFPTVAHFTERRLRRRIERHYAPMVRDQPRWRRQVLARSCRQIDAQRPLEAFPTTPTPLDEMALTLWGRTDLATYGFSSALEIQDSNGRLLSRFGQNLAWLAGPSAELPASTTWEISPASIAVGSATRTVLHARRLATVGGRVLGALHLYVGDDHANLPFLAGRSPQALLFRDSPEPAPPGRAVSLVAYGPDRGVRFSSAEQPPPLDPGVARRLTTESRGFWATSLIDGHPQDAFFFTEGAETIALSYPRLDPLRLAANTVEAVLAVLASALAVLVLLAAFSPLLGRRTASLFGLYRRINRRFTLRLTLAFLVLAAAPVLALQFAVRTFIGDRLRRETQRQALERVGVARKAVEDFATVQKREAPADRPVTDAALVWVASLVRNDMDVFGRGTLLASSKLELYASHLLPARIDGAVYRALALDGEPFVIATEKAGGLPYQVISVPLRLTPTENGILSMPMLSREREARAVLTDVEHGMRLALLLFLAAAAVLAHSMARRISQPIGALTAAAARISDGDLATRVETTSRDELRDLVEAFNRMAADLDRQRDELERTHRLAAWTDMARQVAHEVKNPLTPIQLSTEHLRRVYGDPSVDFAATLETCTQAILKQVRTLRSIVSEFSAFARPPEIQRDPIDLAALVVEALRPYQAALPPGIRLDLDVASVPPVRGDRRMLERVLVNLVENALQALGDAGRIAVTVATANDGRGVRIEVVDSGPGMDAETQRQIFRPFFSTKDGGSGLGLALVRKIARDHDGDVRIESQPGRGTRAVFELPGAGRDAPTT